MKKIIIFVLLTTLFACTSKDDKISLVKNGTLAFDSSKTVGDAIDNYKYFSSTDWNVIDSDNGAKVVEVIGIVGNHPIINKDNGMKHMELKFQFLTGNDNTFNLSWCGFRSETNDGVKIDYKEHVDLNVCIEELQAIYNNSESI